MIFPRATAQYDDEHAIFLRRRHCGERVRQGGDLRLRAEQGTTQQVAHTKSICCYYYVPDYVETKSCAAPILSMTVSGLSRYEPGDGGAFRLLQMPSPSTVGRKTWAIRCCSAGLLT